MSSINKQLIDYLRASIAELKKVMWPSRDETLKQTVVVIGLSIGVAIFLGILDIIFSQILQLIL